MCPTSHVQFVSSQIMIATQKLPCFRRFNQHPKTVHEGLKDRNWVQAMKEEIAKWWLGLKWKRQWGVDGFIHSSVKLMGH